MGFVATQLHRFVAIFHMFALTLGYVTKKKILNNRIKVQSSNYSSNYYDREQIKRFKVA